MPQTFSCITKMIIRNALACGLVLAGLFYSTAHAQDAASAKRTLERARVSILQGDIAGGEQLLSTSHDAAADPNDLDFLEGMIAVAKADFDGAIFHFKAILNRDPSLNRVRLELARAYFYKGDDAAADHFFRAAKAHGVPSEVEVNVDKFLDQIRRRKRWEVGVGVAIAPDTNINAATTAQSVDIFGLPFQLDPTARQKSGVGISGRLAGSYQWSVKDNIRLKVGTEYYDTEYGNQGFTDRNINLLAGPRFLFGRGTEVSVLATGSRRWYGGTPFTYGAGGRVEGQTTLTQKILLTGTISGQELTYDRSGYGDYTGPVVSANIALLYAFDAHSFMRGATGVVREQTKTVALRDTQYLLGGEYYCENLPRGFAVFAGIQGTIIRYDGPLAAFGVTRDDAELDYRLSISNKRIDFMGFTPVVSYLHTDRYSNIGLYAYHRNRGEIGVTRNF